MTEQQLLDSFESRPVYKLTGPPEHWLTTYNTGFWGLEDKYRGAWQDLEQGDLLVFHSTKHNLKDVDPAFLSRRHYTELNKLPSCVLGVGVFHRATEKKSLEWIWEMERNKNRWPLLTHFSEIWWLGNVDAINDESIQAKVRSGGWRIVSDLQNLTERAIPFVDLATPQGSIFGPMGSITGIKPEKRPYLRPLLSRRQLTQKTYSRTPLQPSPIPSVNRTQRGTPIAKPPKPQPTSSKTVTRVETSSVESITINRLGQSQFSKAVKDNYGHLCCFPGCKVNDDNYLIGAHIARWADVEHLRGEMSNGLCLCLMHDNAFERGHFSISSSHRVRCNEEMVGNSKWARENILPYVGRKIRVGAVPPSEEALQAHRDRVLG